MAFDEASQEAGDAGRSKPLVDTTGERSVPTATLDALLRERSTALLCALANDGVRVEMPALARRGFTDQQVIPVPPNRSTMVDLVVPADRMAVVTTWERARAAGVAANPVRLLSAPDRSVMLTFVDGRSAYGVWLGVLSDAADDASASGPDAWADGALLTRRPRTSTIHKNMFAVMTAVDERALRMFGWTDAEMVGVRSLEFIHPDDHERAIANWMELLSCQTSQRVRFRHLCKDGTWLWVEAENTYLAAEDPDDTVVVAQLSDISDEMEAHESVRRRERLFRRLAETLPNGVLQVDADRVVVFANARFAAILGVEHAESLADYVANIEADDLPALMAAFDAAIDEGIDGEVEVRAFHASLHELRRCTVTCTPLTDQEGVPGALVCVTDVTESVRMRDELRAQATTDALTGCYNRASMMAAIDQALAAAPGRSTAVIFVDLDQFKAVNDSFGHAAGDELLVHVARALRGLVRADDIVGRIGGDEFLLLCPGLDRPARAVAVAERLADVLRGDVELSAGVVEVSASVGLAFSRPGSTCESLVAEADAAMYESKRRGDGTPFILGAVRPRKRTSARPGRAEKRAAHG